MSQDQKVYLFPATHEAPETKVLVYNRGVGWQK